MTITFETPDENGDQAPRRASQQQKKRNSVAFKRTSVKFASPTPSESEEVGSISDDEPVGSRNIWLMRSLQGGAVLLMLTAVIGTCYYAISNSNDTTPQNRERFNSSKPYTPNFTQYCVDGIVNITKEKNGENTVETSSSFWYQNAKTKKLHVKLDRDTIALVFNNSAYFAKLDGHGEVIVSIKVYSGGPDPVAKKRIILHSGSIKKCSRIPPSPSEKTLISKSRPLFLHNSTTVRIGDYIYNKTSFKTKVPAIKPEFPFEGLWIAPVDGVSIDGVNFNDSYGAILATTVDVIGLPGGPYEHLLKKLKPKYDQDLREWVVDCALNIDIKLAIGKSEIVIEFGAYTDKLTETKCRLKLDVSQWNRLLLGAPFFTNNGICLNYESDEIHFYEVPHTNSGMKIASSSFLITCLLTFALFLPK
uniref:Peptidase A1 domain-containing protein n=1 Tax=Bursaphelenchus xylophilus TaxID=6326 RepID=A0A1I7SRH5_BURXY